MQCPICEVGTIKTIPAGVSKRTGKKYDSFQVCDNQGCQYKPVTENGRVKEVVNTALPKKPDKDTYITGKKENNLVICRTNLMIALVNKFDETVSIQAREEMFDSLWNKIIEEK